MPGISYNGVFFRTVPDEILRRLERFLPPNPFELFNITELINDTHTVPFSRKLPSPKIGMFYHPSGASRFSFGVYAVTEQDYLNIRNLSQTSVPNSGYLTIDDGSNEFKIYCRYLQPRKIFDPGTSESFWVLVFVDERYDFLDQRITINRSDSFRFSTWQILLDFCHPTGRPPGFPSSTIHADYLTPNAKWRIASGYGTSHADAVAFACGIRLVPSPTNSIAKGLNVTDGEAQYATNVANLGSIIAGEIYDQEYVGQNLPRNAMCILDMGRGGAPSTTSLASVSSSGGYGILDTNVNFRVKQFTVAEFSDGTQFSTYSTRFCTDWYKWQFKHFDFCEAGVSRWVHDGFTDAIEYHWHEGGVFTRVHSHHISQITTAGDTKKDNLSQAWILVEPDRLDGNIRCTGANNSPITTATYTWTVKAYSHPSDPAACYSLFNTYSGTGATFDFPMGPYLFAIQMGATAGTGFLQESLGTQTAYIPGNSFYQRPFRVQVNNTSDTPFNYLSGLNEINILKFVSLGSVQYEATYTLASRELQIGLKPPSFSANGTAFGGWNNIFTGDGIQISGSGVKIPGVQYRDENIALGTPGTVESLNFIGAGVTATRIGNEVIVDIPGGGGGGGSITLTGHVTGSGTGTISTTIANSVITNSMFANAPPRSVKGNSTTIPGAVTDLVAVSNQFGVLQENGSGSLVFALLTNNHQATMPSLTFKGNNTGAVAKPSDLTVAQMQTALAIPAAASVAQQQAGTAVNVYTTPGRQREHPSALKFWVKFSVAAGVVTVRSSNNVSGVVRNAVGDFTITHTAVTDGHAVISATGAAVTGLQVALVSAQTTTTVRVLTFNFTPAATDPVDCFISGAR